MRWVIVATVVGGLLQGCSRRVPVPGTTENDTGVGDVGQQQPECKALTLRSSFEVRDPARDTWLEAASLAKASAQVVVYRPDEGEKEVVSAPLGPDGDVEPASLRISPIENLQSLFFGKDGQTLAGCSKTRTGSLQLHVFDPAGTTIQELLLPTEIERCTRIMYSRSGWLALDKEWATDRPATLALVPHDPDGTATVRTLSDPMRSPGSENPLLSNTDFFGLVYRPYTDRSWPDESVKLQRFDHSLVPLEPPLTLLPPNTVNGATLVAWTGSGYLLVFRYQQPPASESAYLQRLDAHAAPVGPSVPISEETTGDMAIFWTGNELLVAWVEIPEGSDLAFPRQGQHVVKLGRFSKDATPLGNAVDLASVNATDIVTLTLDSRGSDGELQILAAWRERRGEGFTSSVHAVVVGCSP